MEDYKTPISIVVKEPGKNPEQRNIENTLEAFQALVGGYIESLTMGEDWMVICNEEGALPPALPYNCDVCGIDFVGTIALVGYKGEHFYDFPCDLAQLHLVMPELWQE